MGATFEQQYKDILIEFCIYFNSNYHTCWDIDRCKEVIDDFIKFKEREKK